MKSTDKKGIKSLRKMLGGYSLLTLTVVAFLIFLAAIVVVERFLFGLA